MTMNEQKPPANNGLSPEQIALLNNLWAVVIGLKAEVEISGVGVVTIGLKRS